MAVVCVPKQHRGRRPRKLGYIYTFKCLAPTGFGFRCWFRQRVKRVRKLCVRNQAPSPLLATDIPPGHSKRRRNNIRFAKCEDRECPRREATAGLRKTGLNTAESIGLRLLLSWLTVSASSPSSPNGGPSRGDMPRRVERTLSPGSSGRASAARTSAPRSGSLTSLEASDIRGTLSGKAGPARDPTEGSGAAREGLLKNHRRRSLRATPCRSIE